MLEKQRLFVGVPYGRIAINLAAHKDVVWAIIPPLLLALALLSLVLLSEPAKGPVSNERPEVIPPAAEAILFHYADWRQTDGSYLSSPPVLR